MTARETRFALLLLAEENYGAPLRRRQLEARAKEDATWAAETGAVADNPTVRG